MRASMKAHAPKRHPGFLNRRSSAAWAAIGAASIALTVSFANETTESSSVADLPFGTYLELTETIEIPVPDGNEGRPKLHEPSASGFFHEWNYQNHYVEFGYTFTPKGERTEDRIRFGYELPLGACQLIIKADSSFLELGRPKVLEKGRRIYLHQAMEDKKKVFSLNRYRFSKSDQKVTFADPRSAFTDRAQDEISLITMVQASTPYDYGIHPNFQKLAGIPEDDEIAGVRCLLGEESPTVGSMLKAFQGTLKIGHDPGFNYFIREGLQWTWERITRINPEIWFDRVMRYREEREAKAHRQELVQRAATQPLEAFIGQTAIAFGVKKDIRFINVKRHESRESMKAKTYLLRFGETQPSEPQPPLAYCEFNALLSTNPYEETKIPVLPEGTQFYLAGAASVPDDPLDRIRIFIVGAKLPQPIQTELRCHVPGKKAADLTFEDLRKLFSDHFSFEI